MKMDREQKQYYMQAVYYRDLSDRLFRAAKTLLLGAVFILLIGLQREFIAGVVGVSVALGAVGFYQRHKYWRCPKCDQKLPTRPVWQIEKCPICDLDLSGDQKK